VPGKAPPPLTTNREVTSTNGYPTFTEIICAGSTRRPAGHSRARALLPEPAEQAAITDMIAMRQAKRACSAFGPLGERSRP
jgi:hypothetical protein